MAVLSSVPVHDGRLFTWSNREGVTDASMLARINGGGRQPIEGRVFDDACDTGFYVQSHMTGKKMLFVLTETHRDREGDVTHWTFVSYPLRENVKLTLFNT